MHIKVLVLHAMTTAAIMSRMHLLRDIFDAMKDSLIEVQLLGCTSGTGALNSGEWVKDLLCALGQLRHLKQLTVPPWLQQVLMTAHSHSSEGFEITAST